MPDPNRTFRSGLVVGLIAYVAVAAFYGAFDLLAARGPLYTVNVLGSAVFRGMRDPAVLQMPIPVDLAAVFLYNAVHFVASMAIGQIVVSLVDLAERNPGRSGFSLTIIVSGFVVTIVGVGVATEPMRSVLPWWSIVVANAAAVVFAGAYLLARRPGLIGHLTAFARRSLPAANSTDGR